MTGDICFQDVCIYPFLRKVSQTLCAGFVAHYGKDNVGSVYALTRSISTRRTY